MTWSDLDSEGLSVALLLISAMSAAGLVHVIFLRWIHAGPLMQPVDFGLCLRGQRLLGENKRLRGFVALPLAAGLAFGVVGAARDHLPDWLIPDAWGMSTIRYVQVGLVAGFCFMFAELPNSFIKRQLGIAPGELPERGWRRLWCLVADRVDSVIGALIGASVVAPVPLAAWFWVLLIGPGFHAVFSTALHHLGVKRRRL